MKDDIWTPETLELSSRECSELAGLLALTTPERTLRPELKVRLLARIVNAALDRKPGRRLSFALAGIAAILLASGGPWSRRPSATLAQLRGIVSIDGRPAEAGQRLRAGQVIAVADRSDAVLIIGGRVAARLLDGGEALLLNRPGIELELRRGSLLSAVVTGAPYSVVTEHGRISALGTDFMTRTHPEETFFCLCHGRLKVSGAFGETRVESTNHGGKAFTKNRPPHEPRDGSMTGHMPPDLASLRAFLETPRP